jgi:hypothetical protein
MLMIPATVIYVLRNETADKSLVPRFFRRLSLPVYYPIQDTVGEPIGPATANEVDIKRSAPAPARLRLPRYRC